MAFENIHNYYEQLVFRQIQEILGQQNDSDFLDDIACVALNQLPARYVRHNVDMVYYLTSEEREAMQQQIDKAVTHAIEYVSAHRKTAS
ncbi:MAG: late competence development ComFB family protein [Gammaproteobacteria bacterium]|nr:late competence development ComFB family protein [Gammaproteobacteria bacterium]